MPAMHQEVLETMEERLKWHMRQRLALVPFDLTHEECLDLVAPAGHVPILRDAAKYADVSSRANWMSVTLPALCDGHSHVDVVLMMAIAGEKQPPLRPRSPEWQVDKVGGAKVRAWATQRLELGRRFGLAHKTLHELARICDTGAQVRYLWPAVMHLVVGATSTRTLAWAEKNAVFKAQRHVPAIGLGLMAAIKDSSALITACALLGPDYIEPPIREVNIDIWAPPWFDFHGVKVLRK